MKRYRPSDIFLNCWHPYIWIAVAAFLLYARTLSFGFTYLDDNVLILGNGRFLCDISSLLKAFRTRVFFDSSLPYYRPILMASFILDAQAGGIQPFVYHLTNIVIHAAASCLVFSLLVKMNYGRAIAFFFSLAFTVHPLLTQAVAWVPGRNDSLMALFVLSSFVFFLKFLKRAGPANYFLHMVFFALALFTKESACILIAIVFLYLVLISKEKIFSFNFIAPAIGYALIMAGWYSLRHPVVGNSIEMSVFDMAKYLVTYLPAIVQFIGKAVFPFNLSVFPIIQDTSFVYGLAAIAAIALGLLFSRRRRGGFILFGASWLVLFLVPSLIRPHAGVINDVLEHRFYTSMVGLIIILMEIDFLRDALSRRGGPALAAAIIAAFSAISLCHMGDFKDRMTFWKSAVAGSPHSSFAHLALGAAYYAVEETDKAEGEFRQSLGLDRWMMQSNYYLGFIYMKKNLSKEAEAAFRKEIAMHPYFDGGYLALGVLYYRQGRFNDAEALWRRALELNPRNAETMRNLAVYYCERRDFEKSVFYARRLREMGIEVPAEFLKTIGIK